MTEMSPAEQVYFAALEKATPAEQAEYLNEACAGQPELRARVEKLLAAQPRVGNFLEPGTATGAFVPPDEQPGVVIAGRYKLLEAIGEGGMGTVWVAEQTEPVRRKVALKLIKAGMDSKSVLARFEAERQALAVMDHPNIAKVLDGGLTDTGRPFFVMEYVKGVPITEYCDAVKLSVPERLNLFVQVCQAVQHAHQKGIIHRDLKPSNILVAPYDDKPVPKVIDFGLAKAMHQSLTERTLHTAHETVLGTPLYMSPEQAQLNNLDVDTRSDIYSLGVLLYELLTGTTPLEKKRFKEAAWDEIKRLIREEEPPRPSTRLSSSNALPSLAAGRQMEPARLTRLVRGELDWIVMKALEKDRTRRYETANGFAADVLRYLSGEAIQAHPPSRTYRLKKFVRRNKGQVLAAGLVFFALLAGVIGTGIGLIRANHSAENERLAKIDAEEKREKAEIAEQRERERAVGERMAKERESAQRARAEKAYARTADVLDIMVSGVTGDSLATQKAITPEQKKFLTEVLTYYQEFAGEKADDETTLLRTARAAFRVGAIEYRLGRKEEAVVAIHRACDGFTMLAAKYPASSKYRQELASSQSNLGVMLMDLKKPVEAAEQQRKALAIRETLAAEFPTDPEIRSHLADSYGNVGSLLIDLGKKAESEEQQRKGLALRLKLAADYPANPRGRHEVAIARSNLGILLDSMGKHAEAGEQHRRGLALREKLAAESLDKPEYRLELAKVHINLGLNLAALRKNEEAEANYRKALAIQTKLAAEFPADPAYRQVLARGHINISTLLKALGQRKAAEEHCRKGLAILENLAAEFPAEPVYRKESVSSCQTLGRLLAAQGQQPEAEEQFRKGLAIMEKLAADFSAEPAYLQDLANANTILGFHLQGLGKNQEAEKYYRKSMAIQEKFAAEFPNNLENGVGLGGSYCNIGNTVRDSGNPSESVQWFDKAIAVLTPIHGQESQVLNARMYLRNSHACRAIAHDRLKQFAKAIPGWDNAIELSPKEQQAGFRLARVASRLQAGQAAEAVADVAELAKSPFWNADQWYDFACVYAVASGKFADKKQEYADRAMELLHKAVQAGYTNAAHMKIDTDLDALRGREDFKKLIAELGKGAVKK